MPSPRPLKGPLARLLDRPVMLAIAGVAAAMSASAPSLAQDLPLPAPVPAQSAPSGEAPPDAAPSSEIVVSGRVDRGEQKKAVNRFIRAVMRTEASGQYARFNSAICPSAIGFSKEVEALIETRVRTVARAANIALAKTKCDPNLHIVLVDNGPDAVKWMRRKARGAFGRMRPHQRDAIERGAGPVFNWHAVYPVSMDNGGNRAIQNGGGSGAVGASAGILGDPALNAGMTNVKSRIRQPIKQDIVHGMVLIERQAARALSAIQVADFAAMRGLLSAKTDDENLASVETIMTLFDTPKEERLPGLTEWDLALLTALYKAPADMNANRQRSLMAKIFEASLERSQ